jgi:hypothetical protein
MKVALRVPNSILFLYDPTYSCDIPEYLPGKLVSYSENCISIGTKPEMNGETTIEVGYDVVPRVDEIVYSGVLWLPGRIFAVNTSDDTQLISISVASNEAEIVISANDAREPEHILIHLDHRRAPGVAP